MIEKSVKDMLTAISEVYCDVIKTQKDGNIEKAFTLWSNLVWLVDVFKIEKLKLFVRDMPQDVKDNVEKVIMHIELKDFKVN